MTDTPALPTEADYELLIDRDNVVEYLEIAGIAARLAADPDEIAVVEVTAGNMNRVFLARGPLGSVAVKQAPPWVQVAGPDWPIDPARIASEARAYELLSGLVPQSVPRIESVDLDRFILVMEDLSDLDVLRDVLVQQVADAAAGRTPRELDFLELGTVVGRFVAELSLSTSVVGLPASEFAALVESAANPELCALTDAVVLDEPFREHEHNTWIAELDAAVRELYLDTELLAAAATLRATFGSRSEALIHGDLHSGSVMVGTRDGAQATKIFDPEFSFVGPIGMDLGLFWANLTIAGIAARAVGAHQLASARLSAIGASWDEFRRVVAARWPDRVAAPDDLSQEEWLDRIHSDAWGFAGAESIRRVAGYAGAADLNSLPAEHRAAAHGELLQRARGWIVDRADLTAAKVSPVTSASSSKSAASAPLSGTVSVTARTIVLDLEGTTSAAGFILGDLYDYARPRLAPYLDAHATEPLTIEARAQIIADSRAAGTEATAPAGPAGLSDDATTDQVVAVLHEWMANDVKATPLKTLQGQIWATGFAKGEISSHFFDDVIPRLREWHAAGVALSVFSSGSVASQVPWFRHSPDGDLTPLITDYFDTVKAGSKKDPASYDAISASLGNPASDIVFFTDHPEEVSAALAAGWQVVAFSRAGEPWFGADFGPAPVASSFDEVDVAAPTSASPSSSVGTNGASA
ncbi:2,3-diketo-5-methylthio-1-phosphopentane phosphatase/S-methyl-5-thioribose kinase,TIGR01767 [Glaciihabitans tibetensis]|uniref:Enolase-phosphatase E1 n=1 Tax=Glaciihabitans tibetensis TaxID=1266600 RepID=A0A2T0VAQ9_9MICO|nr:S-methyl-5-thioribose kinase [Glaciihabitans tibetensis]PRY67127.1 2,3-diketo-5-methylthio-1-phosphopentane phosphatase/S-methyl-5-thioribose kinase,TIGR01767 [Glaciihabitans tibetensis]